MSTPRAMRYARHVYHVYAIRTRRREVWQERLHRLGIQTGIHYPMPVHMLPAYTDLGYGRGQFPHAERAAAEVLSLPIFPELTPDQCATVCGAVREVATGSSLTLGELV